MRKFPVTSQDVRAFRLTKELFEELFVKREYDKVIIDGNEYHFVKAALAKEITTELIDRDCDNVYIDVVVASDDLIDFEIEV